MWELNREKFDRISFEKNVCEELKGKADKYDLKQDNNLVTQDLI